VFSLWSKINGYTRPISREYRSDLQAFQWSLFCKSLSSFSDQSSAETSSSVFRQDSNGCDLSMIDAIQGKEEGHDKTIVMNEVMAMVMPQILC